MAEETRRDPSHIHRDGDALMRDLVNAYDRSLSGSIDWNGDTFRLLLGGIIDTLHLTSDNLDAAEAREYNARVVPNPAAVPQGVLQPQAAPTADEVAAAMLARLRAEGVNFPAPPPEVREHADARPLGEPDETIPEPGISYPEPDTESDDRKDGGN